MPRRSLLLTGAAVVALLALAALAVWAAFTGVGPADSDGAALAAAVDVRTQGLTTLAVVLTTVGSTAAMAVLAVAVAVGLYVRGHRLEAVWLVGTMVSASAVFTVVKLLTDRPRPPQRTQLLDVANTSLPSGHATMSAVVVGALVVLAWPALTRAGRVGAVLAATLWVGGVGATRIYLGVHWLSDVLAGWATGVAWLALCTWALVTLRLGRRPGPRRDGPREHPSRTPGAGPRPSP